VTTNLDRTKKDLEVLNVRGEMLHLAIRLQEYPKETKAHLTKKYGAKKTAAIIKTLPNFNTAYEAWYSEALAVLRQLLPDRVQNFISLYEKPKSRKSIEYGNYVIQDYLQGLRVTSFGGEVKVDPSAALPQFRQQASIVQAAQRRFESSLFELRQLVQADLFDSELDAARELLKQKYARAAGAVAGVVLEKHLRQVLEDHKIAIPKKHPTLGDLNELLKNSSIIDVPEWRKISLLADLRNLCDHHKGKDPTEEQVSDLIDGTAKVLKTIA